jgi:hypothetical protein
MVMCCGCRTSPPPPYPNFASEATGGSEGSACYQAYVGAAELVKAACPSELDKVEFTPTRKNWFLRRN